MLNERRKIPALNNVNLVPLLDFVVAVIPVLLLSISFFEYVSLDTSLPVFSVEEESVVTKEDNKPKIGLTVVITEQGFMIGGQAGLLSEDGNSVIKRDSKGLYDYSTLNKKLLEIKKKYPEEWSIILIPDPATRFEDIIATMDASREYISFDENGRAKKKTMFPNVVLGGGVL